MAHTNMCFMGEFRRQQLFILIDSFIDPFVDCAVFVVHVLFRLDSEV